MVEQTRQKMRFWNITEATKLSENNLDWLENYFETNEITEYETNFYQKKLFPRFKMIP